MMKSTRKSKIYSVTLDCNVDESLKKFQEQLAAGEVITQAIPLHQENRLVIITEYDHAPTNLLLEEARGRKGDA